MSNRITHVATRDARLILTEEAIEPSLPICDAHHHLWDETGGSHYRLDEFLLDTQSGHNVISSVLVESGHAYRTEGPEALRSIGETDWAVKHTPSSLVKGIVARVDFSLGLGVEELIAGHLAAGGELVCGLRDCVIWDRDPTLRRSRAGLLGDKAFRAGMECAGKAGLPVDVLLIHSQLSEFVRAAESLPNVTFVLNHLGLPTTAGQYTGRRDEVITNWRQSLRELSRYQNVCVKLGGIGIVSFGLAAESTGRPSSDDLLLKWGDDLLFVIETFGPQRCMFESNFPVDKQSVSYTVVWNTFKKATRELPESDRRELFFETAVRTYGIAGRE